MFDAEFPYKLSRFEPLPLSVSTLVVFWVLEQKKQLHIRIGQMQSEEISWFEKRFSQKNTAFHLRLRCIISPSWTTSYRLNPLLSSCYGMKFRNKVRKVAYHRQSCSCFSGCHLIFFRLKRSMLNFGFSLFKHDDNFYQQLHGWIHLGRSFLCVKP